MYAVNKTVLPTAITYGPLLHTALKSQWLVPSQWLVVMLHLFLGFPLTLDALLPRVLTAFSSSLANLTVLHLVCQGSSETTQLVPEIWPVISSWPLVCHSNIGITTGIYAYIHTHVFTIRPCTTEAQGYRELLFELGGGLLENVFLIFSFPSASVDRTSLCAAFY